MLSFSGTVLNAVSEIIIGVSINYLDYSIIHIWQLVNRFGNKIIYKYLMIFLSILTKGNINMNIFGNIVKHFLVDNNLQQNDIAKNANITKANVSQLLNRDNISLDKMLLIAEALDCDLKIELIPRKK